MGEKTKSRVGYSPSASVDYDFARLTPPIRTSTPVNREKGSPPLPPYSVSEVSEVMEIDQGSHHTPRAGTRQLEEEELDEDVMREMERRADEFYETGLRGRCWDVWAQASDWVQVGSSRCRHQLTSRKLRSKSIQYAPTSSSARPWRDGGRSTGTTSLCQTLPTPTVPSISRRPH